MSSSLLLALPLVASFLANARRGAAQGTSAVCDPGWDWMTNSKGQSPCLVSSYLFTPCSPASQSWVYPLTPGFHYNTPLNSTDSATPCRCNTVLYSMINACATCQGQLAYTIPWATYAQNCSTVYLQKFPADIPLGTAVPAWAYLDITRNGTFNPDAAEAIANQNKPDTTATVSVISSSSSSISSPTAPASTTGGANGSSPSGSAGQSSAASSKSDVGPIVGGVVGGVVGAIAIGLGIFFFLRHRRNQAKSQPTGPVEPAGGSEAQYAQYAQYPHPQYPAYDEKSPTQEVIQPLVQPSPKLYDPNDPSTFPTTGDANTGSLHTYPTTENAAYSGAAANYVGGGYQSSTATSQHPTYKGAPEL
ncbi:hypothetical protein L226DRAFT_535239 [Lentinus tigrinus ALCF2SS1-7]|uniref:Uncharacterized protein n=1 Tax=Lentinus tigrinus ALCF2SS1-6 TaxID=1328759 RepID=A0A5C2SDQ0_9APHY|nr:hypothetical protein L227DRAFT_573736 [Lentinus tigrinus ALCF2SS1-6]RPD74355.1 hypothetical protein L226DRAFT_535239 [Lentinus tigrinus ALCF2SS1-7]